MSLRNYIEKERQSEINNAEKVKTEKILENIRRKDLSDKIENCFVKATKDLDKIKQQNKEFDFIENNVIKEDDIHYSKTYRIEITPLHNTKTYLLLIEAHLRKRDEGISIAFKEEDNDDISIIKEEECSFDEFLDFNIEEFILEYLE